MEFQRNEMHGSGNGNITICELKEIGSLYELFKGRIIHKHQVEWKFICRGRLELSECLSFAKKAKARLGKEGFPLFQIAGRNEKVHVDCSPLISSCVDGMPADEQQSQTGFFRRINAKVKGVHGVGAFTTKRGKSTFFAKPWISYERFGISQTI